MTTDTIERPPEVVEQSGMPERYIFVFGSNIRGIHGGGAARTAVEKYGAIWLKGIGHWGRSYAIPTKGNILTNDGKIMVGNTLSLDQIQEYVEDFLAYAKRHPDFTFKVTQIGCGLAGLKTYEVAHLFQKVFAHDQPGGSSNYKNVWFDEAWKPYLCPEAQFWGTYP